MKFSMQLIKFCLISGLVLGVASFAQAAGSNCSSKGIACVSGGIGGTEREEMQQHAKQYSLWIRTAADKSGAYLADIKLTVRDVKSHETILSTTLDGPWAFIALPAGRYEVEASYRDPGKNSDQVVKKSTDIKTGDHRQMVIYFSASNVGELDYKTGM